MLRFRSLVCLALGLAWWLASTAPASAIQILSYNPARHDRFTSGFPAGPPVPNPNLFGNVAPYNTFDYSGFGWSSTPFTGYSTHPGATLISPQHVVVARHFTPSTTLNFLGGDGNLHTYTVSSWHNVTYNGQVSDLRVGTLSAPINPADQVTFYSVVSTGPFSNPVTPADMPKLNWYVGRELIVGGAPNTDTGGPRMGRNRVSFFAEVEFDSPFVDNLFVVYDFNGFGPDGVGGDEALLTSGDSGSPLFMVYDGQLTLLGTHAGADYSASPQLSADTFIPLYIDQINDIMRPTGYQMSVIFVSVPEPSSLLLASMGALAGLRKWRGARRKDPADAAAEPAVVVTHHAAPARPFRLTVRARRA